MTELKASGDEEAPPPYMIFLVVFLFFLTGLLGFLICHLLKKKGYRCRTGDMEDEEEDNLEENEDDENEENQDTVEQILKCIIENEANMEAFNEMLGNNSVCVRHDPRLRKESIGGVPPHLHTVHSGTDHNSCLLCAQVQSKKGRRQSRTPRFKQRPGEQTVFSVGRFRVTHTDKKLHGGPNPLAISGDQLDQSQDSEERKDGGYNLKSMFKEVQLPSDGANGIAASTGKQKKSVTIFGLRRGSDPVGLKPKVGNRREVGGVRFAFQQPPLVLEEPMQVENPETGFVDNTEPGSKPKTETQFEAKKSTSVNSPSIKSKKEVCDSGTGLQQGPKPNETVKPYSQSAAVSAPTSLPGLSDRRVNVDDEVLKPEEAYITGPVQTSTPIAPMPATSPGFSRSTGQPQLNSNRDLLVVQMSSDPCPSPDQGASIGVDLIRLAPSPQSSFPSKTLSSVSSLKSPTPSLTNSPSPKSSSRNVSSEAAITPSTPPSITGSPRPTWKSERTTTGGSGTSSGSKPEEDLVVKADGKTEIKRAGILKPVSKFGPSDLSLKDGPSSLALSPSGSLSPSSPKGSRTSSAAIVKASPDSSREFSVVPVLEEEEEEESSSSVKHQKKTGDDFKPERPTDPRNQSMETSGAEVRSSPGQEKEDLVEMEDIRHCKVTQRNQDQEREPPKDEGLIKRKETTLQTER